ncbi:MAG: lipocalin family protein [Limnohabitans sp.]|nr:lipocalin family protein [Limnohabitans sp.]
MHLFTFTWRLPAIARHGLAPLLLAGLAYTGAVQAQTAALNAAPLQTVPAIDVPRYMGTWHEIAKYPNWFQKKCVSSTSATYSLQADGQVQVLNRCKTANGDWSEALGAARQIGAKDSPRLKVRFAPAWLSFIPMVWGNYWVIDIDPDYLWVVVSEPQREYLWILARTPQLPTATLNALQTRLTAKGFDLQRLEMSAP